MGAAPSAHASQSETNAKGQRTFIAYHGTSWENAKEICRETRFIPSKDGQLGSGVHVGSESKTRGYAENAERHGGTEGRRAQQVRDHRRQPQVCQGHCQVDTDYPTHDAVRSDFTDMSRAPEWVMGADLQE